MSTILPPTLTPFRLEGDYITQLLTNIRTRPISWTSFVKANYLTNENMTLLKNITSVNDQEDPRSRVEVILKDLPTYSKSLFDCIKTLSENNSKNLDLMKILLVMLYDGFAFIDSSNSKLTMSSEIISICKDPYTPLLDTLNSAIEIEIDSTDNLIISILSAYHIIFLLTTTSIDKSTSSKLLPILLSYIYNSLLTSSNVQFQFLGLQLLKEILSVKSFRKYFTSKIEYLDSLVKILLNKNIELQMRYLSIYCLWTLTFDQKTNNLLSTDAKYSEVILSLFKFSNDAVKEKVVRLSISSLINFLNLASSNSLKSKNIIIKKYLLANGLQIVKNLIERKWSDDELKDDLNLLHDLLSESIKSLTNFDEYENEIKTKHLIWSPCHKNSEFWFDNIDKFKENNWKLLKSLVCLLSENTNTNTNSDDIEALNQLYLNQSIVCYDIAMIIKVAPEVVKIINSIGTKTKIMTLMSSPNSSVKFEALRTTQLLVANSL